MPFGTMHIVLADDIRNEVLGIVERAGDVDSIRADFTIRIRNNQSIYPYACNIVLDHMLSTAQLSHEEACHGESLAMAKVYGSPPSYGLLNNFFLGEHNKKNPGHVDIKLANSDFNTIGIVGCGLMGTSIGENCLKSRNNIVLFDASQEALDKAFSHLNPLAESKSPSPASK